MELSIGAVYREKSSVGSEILVRLMGYDNVTILYQPQDYLKNWYFNNLVLKSIYFKYEPSYFFKNFEYVGQMPYSEDQLKTYRPDLPCHLLLSKNVDFSLPFARILQAFDIDGLEFQKPLPSVYLIPKTRKNSDKTPVLVKTESGGLSLAEILEVAVSLRKEWVPEATDIGLHRSGHKQKIPSFYITGFDDLANHISNWEKANGQEYDWRKPLNMNR